MIPCLRKLRNAQKQHGVTDAVFRPRSLGTATLMDVYHREMPVLSPAELELAQPQFQADN